MQPRGFDIRFAPTTSSPIEVALALPSSLANAGVGFDGGFFARRAGEGPYSREAPADRWHSGTVPDPALYRDYDDLLFPIWIDRVPFSVGIRRAGGGAELTLIFETEHALEWYGEPWLIRLMHTLARAHA